MNHRQFLRGESDIFVGRRGRLTRYLVCPMAGFFPVLNEIGNGRLLVVFRTGALHIGITGTLAASISEDGGKSWSDPVEITRRWEDSRNPAVGVNAAGEIVVAFWKAGMHAYRDAGNGLRWDREASGAPRSQTVADHFVVTSRDAGRTWSEPRPLMTELLTLVDCYGRILTLLDGTLLMSGYGWSYDKGERSRDTAMLIRSTDGGITWGNESIVAVGYNETSYALLPGGVLVGAGRSSENAHISVFRSEDGGETWSDPVAVTRHGEIPADLTLLRSGKLLMTFGRRIRPTGCGALVSEDGGATWNSSGEVLLAGDGETSDVGYPSTVELDDGTIVTVLYYANGSEMAESGADGWGRVTCQAIHYREEDIL